MNRAECDDMIGGVLLIVWFRLDSMRLPSL